MNYDWNWGAYLALSPDGANTYLNTFLIGLGWTIFLALCASVSGLIFGSLVAIMRTSSSRTVNIAATAYVEVLRNIPLLVQMFLWYFVLPELLPTDIGTAMKRLPQPLASLVPATGCLCTYAAARFSEQIRSGILALSKGQMQAGLAIGLSEIETYRFVILPQALRIVLPPLTSEFIATVKYSSVAFTIGLIEITGAARTMQEYSFRIFEAFSAATAIYLILNVTIGMLMRNLERRLAIPGLVGMSEDPGTVK